MTFYWAVMVCVGCFGIAAVFAKVGGGIVDRVVEPLASWRAARRRRKQDLATFAFTRSRIQRTRNDNGQPEG